MPKIVRKGVLIRPGKYKYGDVVEVKTAAELKAAAERQPQIMLTLGHPIGEPNVSDFIGRVDQTWNEEKDMVEAEFSFYHEHWESIPEELQNKIVNYDPLSISAGFSMKEVVNDEQVGILYSHVALLQSEENPICPLGECGINVRRESNEMSNKRLEQSTELEGTNTTAPAEPVPEASSELIALKAEVAEMKEIILKLQTPPTVEREPETVEEKGPEVAVEKAVEELPPQPAMVIPAGVTPSKDWEVDADGWIRMELRPEN